MKICGPLYIRFSLPRKPWKISKANLWRHRISIICMAVWKCTSGINTAVTVRQWIFISKAQRCQQIPSETTKWNSSGDRALDWVFTRSRAPPALAMASCCIILYPITFREVPLHQNFQGQGSLCPVPVCPLCRQTLITDGISECNIVPCKHFLSLQISLKPSLYTHPSAAPG